MLLFVLMGSMAGYTSAVTYKAFKGTHWKALTLLTAFLYPGITFIVFFFLNFFIWGKVAPRSPVRHVTAATSMRGSRHM